MDGRVLDLVVIEQWASNESARHFLWVEESVSKTLSGDAGSMNFGLLALLLVERIGNGLESRTPWSRASCPCVATLRKNRPPCTRLSLMRSELMRSDDAWRV